jgi:hypothetical protein
MSYDKEKYKFWEFNEKVEKIESLPDPKSIGSNKVDYKVNVYTEFEQLKGVVVGYTDDTASLPEDIVPTDANVTLEPKEYPDFIIQKNKEVQDKMAEILLGLGINVVRIGQYDFSKKFSVQGYETTGFHCFNPRDIILFYHDSIYECPTFQISRQTESNVFTWIFDQLRTLGSKWFKSYGGLSPFYEEFRAKQGYKGDEVIDKNIPLFDAANLIRIGLDFLFLISESANEESYSLFNSFMQGRYNKKVRIHPIRGFYGGVHFDTCFCVLGWNEKVKKYVVCGIKKYIKPTNIPVIFRGKNWAVLEGPDLEHFPAIDGFDICSPDELGMNFFIINSSTIVITRNQTKLIKYLEFYGIKCILFDNPFGRESGGGLHCMTNDFCREDPKGIGKVLDNKDNNNFSKEELAGYFDPELLEFLSSQGPIDDWLEIANKNKIFPTYLTDHLNEEDKKDLNKRYQHYIDSI